MFLYEYIVMNENHCWKILGFNHKRVSFFLHYKKNIDQKSNQLVDY